MTRTQLATAFTLICALVACDDGDHDHDHVACDTDSSDRASTILALGADAAAGADVFASSCGSASCHGADGAEGPAPDLPEHASHLGSEGLVCVMLEGSGYMPPQTSFSDQELADVLAYVEETF